MANTYTQIHLHCIFAVKYRLALIEKKWKERLHQYITAIVQDNKHKMLQINSMPDHLHMLIGMRPNQSLSDLMQQVKSDSSEWINQNQFTNSLFRWQGGFGAFSYQKKDVPFVSSYIANQETHHSKISFSEEYRDLLRVFDVEYDDRYIFALPE